MTTTVTTVTMDDSGPTESTSQTLVPPNPHILEIFNMQPQQLDSQKDSSIGSHAIFRSDLQSGPKSLWAPTYYEDFASWEQWAQFGHSPRFSHPYSSFFLFLFDLVGHLAQHHWVKSSSTATHLAEPIGIIGIPVPSCKRLHNYR